jgi:hypothetical protein
VIEPELLRGWMLSEGIDLNDQCGTRLAEISRDSHLTNRPAHSNAAFAVDVGQGGVHEGR